MRARLQPILAMAAVAVLTCTAVAAQDDPVVIPISEDRPSLEFVGQFITNGPGAGVSSTQFGYLSHIRGLGLNQIFTGPTHNETTAMFTFYSQPTTVSAIANGAIRVVHRVGTTTIYFNPTPAGDFSNPSSFQQGIPILVSDYEQHVDVDTVTSSFVTAHLNDITATTPFWLNGVQYQLGKVDRSFRTHYLGHLNPSNVPTSGWIGGYAVGVDKKDN